MRACTKRGECFSFSFMSYSYERRKSNGVVRVEHAQLRKQSRKEHNRFADYMLNFIDMDTLEYGMRYYGSGAAVRRADPFSVNPGQRVRG